MGNDNQMNLIERINKIQQTIRQTEISCHREPGSVTLLAVSKGHTSDNIALAHSTGLNNFGESYLQEALMKISMLAPLPICWHYIGSIQSNKTKAIAQHFEWVHGVCREEIAILLNKYRSSELPPLNICIQVNIDNSPTKSGIAPDKVAQLISVINMLPNLRLRGLMVIPGPKPDAQQLLTYLSVADLLDHFNYQFNLTMDTLSMGMSDDLQPAIHAGSTIVRIGRRIFGSREIGINRQL